MLFRSFGVSINFFLKFKKNLLENSQKTLKKFFKLQIQDNEAGKKIIKKLENYFIDEQPPTKEGLEKSLKILEDIDMRNDIKNINIPTLIISGRQDEITNHKASIWMKSKIKKSKIFIFDMTGHIPFIQNQKKCFELIKKFVGP